MTMTTLAFSLLESVLPLKWLAGNGQASFKVHTPTPKIAHKAAPSAIPLIAGGAYPTSASRPFDVNRTPLRIVRIIERGHRHGHADRMVISGRMADVCAELDRLAACEAA